MTLSEVHGGVEYIHPMKRWLLALAVGGVAAIACAVPAGGYPPCFGAAARDPLHVCHNAALALSAFPTPAEAQIMVNTPCEPVPWPGYSLCTYGAPAATASASVAVIGDSHSWQWRAAIDSTAKAFGWLAFDTSRYSCAFSDGTPGFGGPLRAGCVAWTGAVVSWLREHPQISTVFISNHLERVERRAGQSEVAAQVAGMVDAWRALPGTVKHIVVLRDTPYMRVDTLECVEMAIHTHSDAGRACAVPRRDALRFDPDVAAARRSGGARVSVVDLSSFFCGPKLCYPVVGGALVYRDPGHITSTFASTLGPILTRRLRPLLPEWGLPAPSAGGSPAD